MKGLGIMSGSSMDGLDLALVEFSDGKSFEWQLKDFETFPFRQKIKEDLSNLMSKTAGQIALIESEFTRYMVDCVQQFRKNFDVKEDFISVHGHTVIHYPLAHCSWQLVNAGMLCGFSQSVVVADFRNQDMALGGQGAPMAPLADRDLFPGYDYYLNLGGIANLSYKENGDWKAFDVFPFNQLLNYFAKQLHRDFDEDGRMARAGKLNNEVLHFFENHRYLKRPVPKSLDNQEVFHEWIEPIKAITTEANDILRTFIAFSIQQLMQSVEEGKSIYITGGGAKNIYFKEQLRKAAKEKSIKIQIPTDALVEGKEAILIAYAGYLRLKEKSNFISSASGSRGNSISGAVYLPHSFKG